MVDSLSYNMSISSLLANSRQQLFKQRTENKEQISTGYTAKHDILEVELKGNSSREASIRAANGALQVASSNIDRARTELLKMSKALLNIEAGGDLTTNKSNFDLALKSLELASKRGSSERNLTDKAGIGDFSAKTFSYRDPSGRDNQIVGSYIGSDFTIVDSTHGTTWASDLQSGKLIEYTDLTSKVATGREEYLANFQMDSRTGTAISFTYEPSGENYAVTGDVTWGGLGLGDSWYYKGLTTQADIDEARAAVMGAIKKLGNAEILIGSNQAVVDGQLKSVRAEAKEIQGQQGELQFEEEQEIALMDNDIRQRYDAVEKSLARSAQSTQLLMGMMSIGIDQNSPMARASRSLPAAAFGNKLFRQTPVNVIT
jgi:hypothetical protein